MRAVPNVRKVRKIDVAHLDVAHRNHVNHLRIWENKIQGSGGRRILRTLLRFPSCFFFRPSESETICFFRLGSTLAVRCCSPLRFLLFGRCFFGQHRGSALLRCRFLRLFYNTSHEFRPQDLCFPLSHRLSSCHLLSCHFILSVFSEPLLLFFDAGAVCGIEPTLMSEC